MVAEVGGEFGSEEFGEEGGVGDAELFGAVEIEEIVFVDAIGAVRGADGGESFGEVAVERVVSGGLGGFQVEADLAAKPGKLDAWGVDLGEGDCGYGGQNSTR